MRPLFERLGMERSSAIVKLPEEIFKGSIFNCQDCAQCILHYNGMTCPMNCPKQLRNGPCGGVRLNGKCEVKPEMDCVWVKGYERS
ncbi:MAG TPA: methylenetetrahydrofolate reductase C-terminal domain-containing protein, partial [Verrucomicrobiae bacterium]